MLIDTPDRPFTDPAKITLFAAGSLSQAFKKVADTFSRDKGIVLNAEFGSTGRMAKLIEDGMECDVFASADMETPQKFVDSGRCKTVIPFVRNDIVALARKSSGLTTDSLHRFITSPDCVNIGISDPETQPCGANAVRALSRTLSKDDLNKKICIITGGLDKKKEKFVGQKSDYAVALEEGTDLLLIFRTTAKRVFTQLEDAEIIELPPLMEVIAQYGITIFTENPSTCSLVDYLESETARNIFEECGFR